MGRKIYTTKELATICSVTKKTIRHYKNIDLISPSYIDGNGYWYFNEDDVEKLRLIGQLKYIEMSLDEIKNYFLMDRVEREKVLKGKGERLRHEIHQKKHALEVIDKISSIEIPDDINPIHKVIEESHLDWLKKEFDEEVIEVILTMLDQENSMDDHHRLSEIIISMKAITHHRNLTDYRSFLEDLDRISMKYSKSIDGRRKLILAHILMMTSSHSLMNELSQDQEIRIREIINHYYDQKKES